MIPDHPEIRKAEKYGPPEREKPTYCDHCGDELNGTWFEDPYPESHTPPGEKPMGGVLCRLCVEERFLRLFEMFDLDEKCRAFDVWRVGA